MSSLIIDKARTVLRRAGLTVNRYPHAATPEFHLRQLMKRIGVRSVLDVGAHRGEYATMLRQGVRFTGSIVSVEPSSAAYAALSRTMVGDAFWTGRRLALGKAPGRTELRVFEGTVLNSLRAPNGYGLGRFPEALSEAGVEEVEVATLADLLAGIGDLAPDPLLLKLDTQGNELEILCGADAALQRVSVLQAELSVKPLYEGIEALPHSLDAIKSPGFELTGVFPVSREVDGLRLIDVDCSFADREIDFDMRIAFTFPACRS